MNGISQTGNTVTFLAIPWFVLTTTGSPSRTGLASATFAVATIASGLTIGNSVDRLGFRRTSILADMLSGLTVLVIPILFLLDWLSFWQLLVLIFLGAYFDAPGRAARGALVPQLANVSRMPLERANSAIRAAGVSGDVILGPLLFAVLTALMRPVNVLFVDAATFAVSLLIVAFFISAPATATKESQRDEPESGGRLDALLAGFRFVFGDRVIGVVQLPAAIFSFVLGGYFGVLLPVYVNDQLGSPAYLGALIAALGGGTLIGTIAYGSYGQRYGRYPTLIVSSVVSAAAIWLFTVPSYLPTDLIAMFIFGFAGGPFNPLIRTLVQKRAPEQMLGRVLNAMFTTMAIVAPLGILASGFSVDAVGLQATLFVAAILITLVPLWFGLAPWPRRAAPAFET